jgi:hypothetical protein
MYIDLHFLTATWCDGRIVPVLRVTSIRRNVVGRTSASGRLQLNVPIEGQKAACGATSPPDGPKRKTPTIPKARGKRRCG